jgi:hypothetical protein
MIYFSPSSGFATFSLREKVEAHVSLSQRERAGVREKC